MDGPSMRCCRLLGIFLLRDYSFGVILVALSWVLAIGTESLCAQGPAGAVDSIGLRSVTASRIEPSGMQALVAIEGGLRVVSKGAETNRAETKDPVRFESARSFPISRSIQSPFSQINSLDFSPDASRLLIAGGDPGQLGGVECIEWPSSTRLGLFQTEDQGRAISDVVTEVDWFPGGSQWVESHWSGWVLVRRIDGTVRVKFGEHTGPVLSAMAWDEQTAISSGLDQTIKVWRVADGEQVRSLDNHTGAVVQLLGCDGPSDKRLLVSAGRDRTIRLWDPSIGRLIRFVKLPEVPVRMELSDSGLIVALENGSICEVSLPSLRIDRTVSISDRPIASMVQISRGVWWFW